MKTKVIGEIYLRYYSLLSAHDKKKIYIIIALQILVSFLDVIGIALLGIVGALTVTGIQSSEPAGKVAEFINFINLSEASFQNQVATIGLTAAGILLLRTFISVYFTRKTLYFFSIRSAHLSKQLIEKLLSQDLLKIQNKSSQELLFATTYGTSVLMLGIFANAVNFIVDFALLFVLVSVLFIVDPIIAACTFLLLGSITGALYKKLNRRARDLGRLDSELSIESSTKILEVLSTYRESTVRNRRHYYVEKVAQTRLKLASAQAETNFMPNISKYVVETGVILGSILVAGLQFLSKDAQQSFATLSVFMGASSRIAPTLLRLQQGLLSMRNSNGAATNTLQLIDSLKDVVPRVPNSNEDFSFTYEGFTPKVEISNVTLNYPASMVPALDQVSLSIVEGDFVAFVGTSGAGKTTIVDTLLGVLMPDSGQVLISGVPPLEASSVWPGAISYLPQEVFICEGSIRENVCLGYPIEIATDERVLECLRLAQLEKFVEALPEGLESRVGENGTQLSGGQRQRLGIARAFFTNPKLIVLDESTSALDAETEAAVSEAIVSLKGEVTIVMIAHRLSTVRKADQVFYLSGGKLLASGSFDEVRDAVPNFNEQAILMGL
jgi:ABC-type multidrug transport system fused ATPase/permease subunit